MGMDLKGVGHDHLITMETAEGTGVSVNAVAALRCVRVCFADSRK